MPRDPLAGLEKAVVELPFVDGLSNSFSEHLREKPEDALLVAENVELSQLGKFKNRDGFVAMTPLAIGDAGATSIANAQQKLFQRDKELGVIANTQVALGSGAGWAGTGDTVYTYTPNAYAGGLGLGAWKAHGKIARPTLSGVNNISPDTDMRIVDCATTGNFMLVAWHSRVQAPGTGTQWGDMYFRVVDTSTNTTVIDTTLFPTLGTHVNARTAANILTGAGYSTRGLEYQAKLQCLTIGTRLYCFWLAAQDALAGSIDNDLLGFWVDTALANPGPSATVLVSAFCNCYSVSTDGTNAYLAVVGSAAPNTVTALRRTNALAASASSSGIAFTNPIKDVNVSTSSGIVAVGVVTADAPTNPLTASWWFGTVVFGTAALAVVGTKTEQIYAPAAASSKLFRPDIVVLSSTKMAWCVTQISGDSSIAGNIYPGIRALVWGLVNIVAGATTNTTVQGTFAWGFVSEGITNVARLFTVASRVFVPVVKTDVYPSNGYHQELGYFVVELGVADSQNTGDKWRQPMMAANWASDISAPVLDTNTIAPYQGTDITATKMVDYYTSLVIGALTLTTKGSSIYQPTIDVIVTVGGAPTVWQGTISIDGGPLIAFTSIAAGFSFPLTNTYAEGLYLVMPAGVMTAGWRSVLIPRTRIEVSLPSGSVNSTKYYLANRIGKDIGVAPTPRFSAYSLGVAVLDFADPYRWQSKPAGQLTAFGAAAMSAFDGRRVFECGITTRPRIVNNTVTTSAADISLTPNKLHYLRAVYTWLDAAGNRWFSAPSYAQRAGDSYLFFTSAYPGTPPGKPAGSYSYSSLVYVTLPQCFSGMVNGSDYFKNSMEIWIYMTLDVPDVYILAAQVKGDAIAKNTYDVFYGAPVVGVLLDSAPVLSNDQLYVSGGELENSPAPSARVIEAHRDRLFAIDGWDNNVYYTKPAIAGRGIEWCKQTQYIPITETGLGLASNETCLMIFTKRGVYALEGYGPSSTGQPVQAFGTLQLISNQLGIYEVNSCKSTPVGVIFRTNQGWWMVDRSLTLTYIGAPIDGMMSSADRTLAINVDPNYACVRIMVAKAGFGTNGYTSYNYWYDSKRWSTDYSVKTATYRDAMVFGDDYYLLDGPSVLARQSAVFGASWVDGLDDVNGHNQRISTGWITLANMAMYKRIWRVIATVENLTDGTNTGGNNANPANPQLRMRIWADWDDTAPILTKTWRADELGLGVQTVRAHMPKQKMKAIKVEISQVPGVPNGTNLTPNNNPGYSFIGLGFEVGVKNRTSPEKAARTT